MGNKRTEAQTKKAEGFGKGPGVKKGTCNNPKGRGHSPAKFTLDFKKQVQDCMDPDFVKGIFTDIEAIQNKSEKVKHKIKILEFFIPKPRDPEEIESVNKMRQTILEAFGLKKGTE